MKSFVFDWKKTTGKVLASKDRVKENLVAAKKQDKKREGLRTSQEPTGLSLCNLKTLNMKNLRRKSQSTMFPELIPYSQGRLKSGYNYGWQQPLVLSMW